MLRLFKRRMQVEYGKLVGLLFSSYSSPAFNRAGNDVGTLKSSSSR